MSREQASVDDVIQFLCSLGIDAFEMHTGGFPMEPEDKREVNGDPDYDGIHNYVVGMHDGLVLIICVKRIGARTEGAERRFIIKVQKAGHIAFIARTLDQVAVEISNHWPESLIEKH
jgi:hypothetical protein